MRAKQVDINVLLHNRILSANDLIVRTEEILKARLAAIEVRLAQLKDTDDLHREKLALTEAAQGILSTLGPMLERYVRLAMTKGTQGGAEEATRSVEDIVAELKGENK